MQHFEQKFTLFPVGQGLFYSGLTTVQFRNGSEDAFRFVFDCGSMTDTNANEEVDAFRVHELGENERLKLLVVSHFDADHINKIGRLLEGSRKIDKIVMPFTSFAERLFMALQLKAEPDYGQSPDDAFTTSFILDPLNALRNNLDGDSAVFWITGPEEPAPGGTSEAVQNPDANLESAATLEFDFPNGKTDMSEADSLSSNPAGNFPAYRAKKVHYLEPGVVTANGHGLVEFLFYRRDIGPDEMFFFQKVMELFCKKYAIRLQDNQPSTDDLAEALSDIRGATKIRDIFSKAIKLTNKLDGGGRSITNMNTTCLCMLHRNLPSIASLLGEEHLYQLHITCDMSFVKKLDGTNNLRVETSIDLWDWDYWPYRGIFRRKSPGGYQFAFPNTLLTADAYLKNNPEATRFVLRYQRYWEQFWLFQVPHHGSKNNADKNLLTRLLPQTAHFINYGIYHRFIKRFQHPSAELVNDLVASGQAGEGYPVTEYSGLVFSFQATRRS